LYSKPAGDVKNNLFNNNLGFPDLNPVARPFLPLAALIPILLRMLPCVASGEFANPDGLFASITRPMKYPIFVSILRFSR